jgi:hypothetical protein
VASQRVRSGLAGLGQAVARWPRWLRWLGGVTLIWLGLCCVLNAALNLGPSRRLLTNRISADPVALAVTYRYAWFFWPTLVYARQVEVRGSNADVQWRFEIDEARLSLDLGALFGREFHLRKLRARGVGFRLRQKLEASDATPERLSALPPIPGFEAPPIREAAPPTPDISDAEYDLWTVRIEDIETSARQIWIDELHFEGDTRVVGTFFLKPQRWLWVGPARATFLSGSVLIGEETFLQGTSGFVDCTIRPFDPRPPAGIEMLQFVSGTVSLDATIPDARALDYYTRSHGSSVAFAHGEGTFHLDGGLASGVVRPLNLAVQMRQLQASSGEWLGHGTLELSAKTGPAGPHVSLVRMAPFELRHTAAKSALLQAPELRLSASTDELDVSKPAPDFDLQGDLPAAQVPDLRVLNHFTSGPGELHVDSGAASLASHFEANTRAKQAKGELTLASDAVAAHLGELRMEGSVAAKAELAKLGMGSGNLDVVSASVDLKNVRMQDSNRVVSDWWSHVEARAATLRPSQKLRLDLPWTAKLKSAAPVLAFSKRTPSVPGWITRALTGGEVAASGRLQAGRGFVELSNLKAQATLLEVEGDVRQRGEATSGVFRVSAGPLSVGIELENENTKVIFFGNAVQPPLQAPAKPAAAKPGASPP